MSSEESHGAAAGADEGGRGHDGRQDGEHRRDDEHRPPSRPPNPPPGRVIRPPRTHGDLAVGLPPMRAARSAELERSIHAMATEYPWLRYSREAAGARWTGRVQPVQASEVLPKLLDDLAHDRPVYVQGGVVQHLPHCGAQHAPAAWMKELRRLDRSFEISIMYGSLRAVPRCYVVSPAIPPRKRRHMWGDGAMCAFMASEDVWVWNRDTVADAMPYFLVWLVKWMVFDETGIWIGSEHQADPGYHRRVVGRNDQCWCGSGLKYKRCHLGQEERALAQRARVGQGSVRSPESVRWGRDHVLGPSGAGADRP